MSTPTPRTSAVAFFTGCDGRERHPCGDYVESDFARTLERELASERAKARACDQLHAEVKCDQLRDEVKLWELAFQEQFARAERAEAELAKEQAYVSALEDQLDSYGLEMARKQAGREVAPP